MADDRVEGLAPAYEQLRDLGRGTFGRVVLARDLRHPHKPLVAIKLIERGSFVRDYRVYVAREILHHGSLMHPFIVGLYSVFLTPKYLAIAMEYAAGGDLYHHLKAQQGHRLPEARARYYFQQLVIGMEYIHGRGVANRDLKLENLLLDAAPVEARGAMLKMADFGYSKHEMNSSARTHVGTPVYMSPEVILGGKRYDPKRADIWSAGVVLYVLLAGRYPFDQRAPDYALRVMHGAWAAFDPGLGVSPAAQDLVARMLKAAPAERATLAEILAHPWVQEGLPPLARSMNETYWRAAPDPSRPPLAQAAAVVEQIVVQAAAPGAPGEARLECPFPAAEALREGGQAAPP